MLTKRNAHKAKITSLVLSTPGLRSAAVFAIRTRTAIVFASLYSARMFSWLLRSREHTNITFDLTDNNRLQMAAFVSHISGKSFDDVIKYFSELEGDQRLNKHIKQCIEKNRLRFKMDDQVRWGKRLGWYAFVRAVKPNVVVETGVDKGLGALAITAALRRNALEGRPGQYYGTDINPSAGALFGAPYNVHGEILFGDSIVSLKKLTQPIDLFINDSDHSAEYEEAEYEVIADKLSDHGIILGDNCHVTDRLLMFSMRHGRGFLFFAERPKDHWYPGGGIGASFNWKAS